MLTLALNPTPTPTLTQQRPATRTPDVALLESLLELEGVIDRAVEDALRTVLRLAGMVAEAAEVVPGLLHAPQTPRADAAGSARTLEVASL